MHVYVMLFLHLLLLSTIVESSTGESVVVTVPYLFLSPVTLSPHGVTVCPGQDLVYNCTSPSANVFWIYYSEQGVVVMQLNTMGKSENLDIPFGSFTIRVLQRTFDPTTSIVSTATLNNALLSHNNTNIQCNAVGIMNANKTATVLISGNHHHKTSSFNILLYY